VWGRNASAGRFVAIYYYHADEGCWRVRREHSRNCFENLQLEKKKVQISFVRKSQTNKARLSVFEPGTIRHARTISRWVSRRGADRSLDLTVESALLRFFRFFRSSHIAKAIPRVAGDGNAGSARG
jgi:hypothetical protein